MKTYCQGEFCPAPPPCDLTPSIFFPPGGGAGQSALENVVPQMDAGGNVTVQTAAVGTNWTAFAANVAKQLTLVNNSGTTISFRQDGAGVALDIPTGSSFTILGLDNANQISVRRTDTSNTQVTVGARWER